MRTAEMVNGTPGRTKNGNGRLAKYQRDVADAAGLANGQALPYAPDYLDSLVRRMKTPGDFTERTFAWTVYRASGNQSLIAIHLDRRGGEDVETELRQRDCCLDLAWLEAGHREEWLDAPREMFEQEALRRGVEPIPRSYICEGFTANRDRGTVASDTGYRIELVPSPPVEIFFLRDVSEKIGEGTAKDPTHGGNQKAKPYEEFCAHWNAEHPAEFEEWRVAHATYKRIEILRLVAYRKAQKLATSTPNQPPSLESIESLETIESVSQSVSHSEEQDRPTDRPDSAIPDSSPPPIPDDAEKIQNLLIEELGDRFPSETPGRTLCLQIVQALGDAPYERLRIKLRAHKWKRGDSMGLALALAHDVRQRWILDSKKRREAEQAAKAVEEASEPEQSDEETREMARAEAEKRWDDLPAAVKQERITKIAAKVIYGRFQSPAERSATAEQAAKSQFVDETISELMRSP